MSRGGPLGDKVDQTLRDLGSECEITVVVVIICNYWFEPCFGSRRSSTDSPQCFRLPVDSITPPKLGGDIGGGGGIRTRVRTSYLHCFNELLNGKVCKPETRREGDVLYPRVG